MSDTACVCIDVGGGAEILGASPQRHDDFFQRAVSRAFPDSVDRAFDLTRAGVDGGQTVGDGHTEVIVTVHAQHGLFDVRDVRPQIPEELGEFTSVSYSRPYPGY